MDFFTIKKNMAWHKPRLYLVWNHSILFILFISQYLNANIASEKSSLVQLNKTWWKYLNSATAKLG